MYYIKQIQNNDCGLACLKMLLAHFHKDKKYLFIQNKKEDTAYSYKDLIEIGKDYGVELQGIKIKEKEEILKNNDYPLMVTIKEEGGTHAVIVEKIIFKRVLIYDPLVGKRYLAIDYFFEIWDMTALMFLDYAEKKKNPPEVILIDKKQKLVSFFLQVLASVFCVLGVYFLNDPNYQIFPILCFVIFIVLEILSRLFNMTLMKKMDTSFLELLDKEVIKDKTVLVNYEQFKKQELTSGLTIFSSFLICVFLIAVSVLNGMNNLIFIATAFLISFIKVFLFDKYFLKEDIRISKEEKKMTNISKIEEYKITFDNLHKKSYKVAVSSLLFRYGSFALIILSVFISMRFVNLSSVTYLIFYSTLSFYLFEQLNSVFSIGRIVEEYRLDKCKFLNSISTNNQKDR